SRLSRFARAFFRRPWAVAAALLAALAPVVWVWLASGTPPRDQPPNREPIPLLGTSDFAVGWRWALGEGDARVEDGVLRMESREPALVEAAVAPPWRRYRLRAKVQALDQIQRAGLYLLRQEQPLGDRREQSFLVLAFTERGETPPGS